MITPADRIIRVYDETIHAAGFDGMKLADARELVVGQVAADPDAFDLPSVADLRYAYIARVIDHERSSRKSKRIPLFQLCRDALDDLTILGARQPQLDIAMRVGTSDGLDKALRYFAIEDWLDVLGASRENVKAAITADMELGAIVNPIIVAYAQRRATHLEDLFRVNGPWPS